MDFGDGVLDLLALDGFFDHAILDLPLQADELALLERFGEVGEIAPGVDGAIRCGFRTRPARSSSSRWWPG